MSKVKFTKGAQFCVLMALLFVSNLSIGSLAAAPKGLKCLIALKETKVCKGTRRVNIAVEISNNGKETVNFPLSGLGYFYFGKDPGGRLITTSVGEFPLSDEIVTIQPGTSHKFNVDLPFDPNPPRGLPRFDIQVIIFAAPPDKKPKDAKIFKGKVESNHVELEYSDCSTRSPKMSD